MLKRFFNYFKPLRYRCTETYYIKTEYMFNKEVQEFLDYRKDILEKINCKFELIMLKDLELDTEEIGKVKLEHPKYKVTSNAILGLRNGMVFWKFVD